MDRRGSDSRVQAWSLLAGRRAPRGEEGGGGGGGGGPPAGCGARQSSGRPRIGEGGRGLHALVAQVVDREDAPRLLRARRAWARRSTIGRAIAAPPRRLRRLSRPASRLAAERSAYMRGARRAAAHRVHAVASVLGGQVGRHQRGVPVVADKHAALAVRKPGRVAVPAPLVRTHCLKPRSLQLVQRHPLSRHQPELTRNPLPRVPCHACCRP